MRTFIAIELPPEIKQELAKLQADLKQANADVKWVEPDNIHLTLKFLGEISDEQFLQVKAALDKIAGQFKPYDITLSEIGAFPKLDYPRVIWIGIGNGKDQTKQIADKIEEELFKLGFPKEGREFSSHITIGRVRSPKNKQALKDRLQTLTLNPYRLPLQQVSSLILYQSKLSPHGPTYISLHEAKLA